MRANKARRKELVEVASGLLGNILRRKDRPLEHPSMDDETTSLALEYANELLRQIDSVDNPPDRIKD